MKATLVFIIVCGIVFFIGQLFGNAQDMVIGLLLPDELEDVAPAANLVVLPLQTALQFKDSILQVIASLGGMLSALISFEILELITELLKLLIAIVAGFLQLLIFIASLVFALIAVVLGLLLTAIVLVGGIFA